MKTIRGKIVETSWNPDGGPILLDFEGGSEVELKPGTEILVAYDLPAGPVSIWTLTEPLKHVPSRWNTDFSQLPESGNILALVESLKTGELYEQVRPISNHEVYIDPAYWIFLAFAEIPQISEFFPENQRE